MVVMTLIVTSFASNARREQRQALDRQLSSQAFLAAESGVNYAKKEIADVLKDPALTASAKITKLTQNSCSSTPKAYLQQDAKLSESAEISCMLVSVRPSTLEYDLDPTRQAKIIPIKPSASITSLRFRWSPSAETGTNLVNCTQDLKSTTNPSQCMYAVLRADLVRADGAVNRTSLAQNTYAGVFMPINGSATNSVSFNGTNAYSNFGSGGSQGLRSRAQCNTTYCEMTINGVTGSQYYLRLGALYRKTKVSIAAMNGATEVPLDDAQVLVDVTGKSSDVLRRIQVRVPLTGENGNVHADYGLQTQSSICKAFTSYYNVTDIDPATGNPVIYNNQSGC